VCKHALKQEEFVNPINVHLIKAVSLPRAITTVQAATHSAALVLAQFQPQPPQLSQLQQLSQPQPPPLQPPQPPPYPQEFSATNALQGQSASAP
jgi:hypothetical protein